MGKGNSESDLEMGMRAVQGTRSITSGPKMYVEGVEKNMEVLSVIERSFAFPHSDKMGSHHRVLR